MQVARRATLARGSSFSLMRQDNERRSQNGCGAGWADPSDPRRSNSRQRLARSQNRQAPSASSPARRALRLPQYSRPLQLPCPSWRAAHGCSATCAPSTGTRWRPCIIRVGCTADPSLPSGYWRAEVNGSCIFPLEPQQLHLPLDEVADRPQFLCAAGPEAGHRHRYSPARPRLARQCRDCGPGNGKRPLVI